MTPFILLIGIPLAILVWLWLISSADHHGQFTYKRRR